MRGDSFKMRLKMKKITQPKITRKSDQTRTFTTKELANFMSREFAELKTGSINSIKEYLEKLKGFVFSEDKAYKTLADALNLLHKNKQIKFRVVAWGKTIEDRIDYDWKTSEKRKTK